MGTPRRRSAGPVGRWTMVERSANLDSRRLGNSPTPKSTRCVRTRTLMDEFFRWVHRRGRIVIGTVAAIAGRAARSGDWAVGAVTGGIALGPVVGALLPATGTPWNGPSNGAAGMERPNVKREYPRWSMLRMVSDIHPDRPTPSPSPIDRETWRYPTLTRRTSGGHPRR